MSVEQAIQAAFHGTAATNLSIMDHPLRIEPMMIEEQGAAAIALGRISHVSRAGGVDRVHFRLEVRNHRLVLSKRRLELAEPSSTLAGMAPAWMGAADHLLALFAQHLALDPDFDRIQIAFPIELAEVG